MKGAEISRVIKAQTWYKPPFSDQFRCLISSLQENQLVFYHPMAGMLLATHCGNVGNEPMRRQRGECHVGRLDKEGVAVKEKEQGPALTVSHFGGESSASTGNDKQHTVFALFTYRYVRSPRQIAS